MKNILEEINSSLNDTEEQINKLEDIVLEILMLSRKQRTDEKEMRTVWDLFNNIKHTKIFIIMSKTTIKGAEKII